MKLKNEHIVFENLITATPSVVGDVQQITARIEPTSSLHSSIGEMDGLLGIEQLGRQAVLNFNKNFKNH